MLLLTATTDKIQLVTSSTATTDVHASYMDMTNVDPPVVKGTTSGRLNTPITTATTTDIVAAPAASTIRNVKTLHIRNKHASTSQDVTVVFNQNGTSFELHKATLAAGDTLEYVEGVGFYLIAATVVPQLTNYNTTDQNVAAGTTVQITGTNIQFPSSRPIKIGTTFTWELSITKTAAGTASNSLDIRVGTNGTSADTSRLAFATGTGTAAVDTASVVIRAVVRGPIGSSCIVEGNMRLVKAAAAAAGFSVNPSVAVNTTSAGFDVTTNNIIFGLSITTAALTVLNFELVRTEVTGA